MGNVKRSVLYTAGNDGLEATCEIIASNSDTKVEIADNTPRVSVNIELKYATLALPEQFDLTESGSKETLNITVGKEIEKMCFSCVSAAQQRLKADIFGFGDAARIENHEYWNTVKNSWDEVFGAVQVDITVKASLLASGDTTKSFFFKEEG
jgi:spore germination protein KC